MTWESEYVQQYNDGITLQEASNLLKEAESELNIQQSYVDTRKMDVFSKAREIQLTLQDIGYTSGTNKAQPQQAASSTSALSSSSYNQQGDESKDDDNSGIETWEEVEEEEEEEGQNVPPPASSSLFLTTSGRNTPCLIIS